jgi:hypothetical protein
MLLVRRVVGDREPAPLAFAAAGGELLQRVGARKVAVLSAGTPRTRYCWGAIGVFALGLVTLSLSQFILPDWHFCLAKKSRSGVVLLLHEA